MKQKLNLPSSDKMMSFVKRYKYVLIIIIAGIAILSIPVKEGRLTAHEGTELAGGEEDFSIGALENELSEILSKIDGAGRVSVMLTAHSGTERIFAMNREQSADGQESEVKEEAVVISAEDGEEAVLIGQNYPIFRGALVVCPGGDDPEVVLMLTRALSALTGLSSSRITVCKGS